MRISDKVTDQMLALQESIPSLDEAELWETLTHAAQEFTAWTLREDLPASGFGVIDTSDFARRLSAQRAEVAKQLWLAVKVALVQRRQAVSA